MQEVLLYTDGACSGNPGPGGWAGVVIYDLVSILTGYETKTTNNRNQSNLKIFFNILSGL